SASDRPNCAHGHWFNGPLRGNLSSGWVMAKSTKSVKQRQPKHRRKRSRALEATLAALAHDIRTPLTGILALSELLLTSALAERERGWAAAIKSTAEHLAMLTS